MILVTGCAGFIGSNLTKRLLEGGHKVTGIDNFSDYYPKSLKEKNMQSFIHNKNFEFIESDILKANLEKLLEGKGYIFHQAAQAGVRASWGKSFEIYANNNILATQKLLEACKNKGIKKFIYASSSSVYGDAETMPTEEIATPEPISPYGVSKLAGEYLCYLYWKNFGVPVISLRYFTVYGPGQRPDMAFHKFIKAILERREIKIYGDGNQTRDFTYVDDVVNANLIAMKSKITGEIFNIGGGSRITVNKSVEILEKLIGKKADIKYIEMQKGDVRHTSANITKAQKMLGYEPCAGIEKGLPKEIGWIKDERI